MTPQERQRLQGLLTQLVEVKGIATAPAAEPVIPPLLADNHAASVERAMDNSHT
jgi:hypothetical protein